MCIRDSLFSEIVINHSLPIFKVHQYTHIPKRTKIYGLSLIHISDPTVYEALKNMEQEEERFHKLLDTIFALCELSDFHIEERIVIKDKRCLLYTSPKTNHQHLYEFQQLHLSIRLHLQNSEFGGDYLRVRCV